MKFKLILVIFLFFSMFSFAHRDKKIHETYGNVKISMRSGYYIGEMDKIKVVGKLAEKLAMKLHYKDTIFVEYIHDYANIYLDDLYILEYNNINYRLWNDILPFYHDDRTSDGFSVRIYANSINIVEILKLVEYTIINKEKTKKFITKKAIKIRNFSASTTAVLDSIITFATDDKLIKKIFSTQSEIVNDLIKEKVFLRGNNFQGIHTYWQNNKFIFQRKTHDATDDKVLFELNEYFYAIYVSDFEIVVFSDKNSFYYIYYFSDQEIPFNKVVASSEYCPMEISKFDNKLVIARTAHIDEFNIYLIDKNKVISEFE